MKNWRKELEEALASFIEVSKLAGDPVSPDDLQIEYLPAPHKPPSNLPKGKMAVYAFWWNDQWLKIGKAGPNSSPRYISQHYTGKAPSTLRGSIEKDPKMKVIIESETQDLGKWIKDNTCRLDILISTDQDSKLLSLLEAFLHVRLNPRYEGKIYL